MKRLALFALALTLALLSGCSSKDSKSCSGSTCRLGDLLKQETTSQHVEY